MYAKAGTCTPLPTRSIFPPTTLPLFADAASTVATAMAVRLLAQEQHAATDVEDRGTEAGKRHWPLTRMSQQSPVPVWEGSGLGLDGDGWDFAAWRNQSPRRKQSLGAEDDGMHEGMDGMEDGGGVWEGAGGAVPGAAGGSGGSLSGSVGRGRSAGRVAAPMTAAATSAAARCTCGAGAGGSTVSSPAAALAASALQPQAADEAGVHDTAEGGWDDAARSGDHDSHRGGGDGTIDGDGRRFASLGAIASCSQFAPPPLPGAMPFVKMERAENRPRVLKRLKRTPLASPPVGGASQLGAADRPQQQLPGRDAAAVSPSGAVPLPGQQQHRQERPHAGTPVPPPLPLQTTSAQSAGPPPIASPVALQPTASAGGHTGAPPELATGAAFLHRSSRTAVGTPEKEAPDVEMPDADPAPPSHPIAAAPSQPPQAGALPEQQQARPSPPPGSTAGGHQQDDTRQGTADGAAGASGAAAADGGPGGARAGNGGAPEELQATLRGYVHGQEWVGAEPRFWL